jgi:hypothetical protein
VKRYLLPRLGAMNFVLDEVLDGGVNDSLNLDMHGKALSFHLLPRPSPFRPKSRRGSPTPRKGADMAMPTIRHVRAFTLRGAGADYHDQGREHWIDDHIATPMAKYPEYRQSRQSFGLNVLGTLVVEVEASDGTVGFAVTTGGDLGCWIVEKHLARFIEGRPGHRDREDLGPDVQRDAVLRPQGHRAQHDLRRRPGAVGPAGQGARPSRCTRCWAARCATNCSST